MTSSRSSLELLAGMPSLATTENFEVGENECLMSRSRRLVNLAVIQLKMTQNQKSSESKDIGLLDLEDMRGSIDYLYEKLETLKSARDKIRNALFGEVLVHIEDSFEQNDLLLAKEIILSRIPNEADLYDVMTPQFLALNRAGKTLIKKGLYEIIAKQQQVSVLYIDGDSLKKVNDQLGHHAGDLMIKHVANTIYESLYRANKNIAVRKGGDEFLIYMVNTNGEEACLAAERIRGNIEKSPLYCLNRFSGNGEEGVRGELITKRDFLSLQEKYKDHIKSSEKCIKREVYEWRDPEDLDVLVRMYRSPITVSIGVSECIPQNINQIEEAVKEADENLYLAKGKRKFENGRWIQVKEDESIVQTRNCVSFQGRILNEDLFQLLSIKYSTKKK